MSALRTARRGVLAVVLTACLALPAAQGAQAAPAQPTRPPAAAAPAAPAATTGPYDDADRVAAPPRQTTRTPAPGGRANTPAEPDRLPGRTTTGTGGGTSAGPALGGTVPCTLDGITGLGPDRLADFLTDPAVTAEGCLHGLIWTWDARLVPVLSRAHVQAVARRATELAPAHDGSDSRHLLELFTYLHAAVHHDFSHTEIDLTDPATVDAMRRAIAAYGTAAHTFDPTRANADTLREALTAGSAQGLREHQLPLVQRVLATMAPGATTATDTAWGKAVLAALTVNYLGIYPGNNDTAFRRAAAGDPGYRAAFRAFAGYGHLKGTANAWAARDALSEYGRFGQIDGLRPAVTADLGALLKPAEASFGDLSAPWASLVSWLILFDACKPYGVCKPQVEARVFPQTYTYDKAGLEVRTALDHETTDALYYASKQVKAQFFRVLGTDAPLAGDPNTTLHVRLYASRAQYEVLQPLLTGLSTNNGGMYIEQGATFYTYQRRVPQDSQLTLEELFRHEYTHYLNGRWAVPGMFGEPRWYTGDLTTAMDEGTAEFFAGATREEGVKVRKSLVKSVIADTAGGRPRMTVDQFLHATYDGDGFRFYSYAGTFFSYLWQEHPSLLREMYAYERADDPKGFDAWRTRLGRDTELQQGYDAFLDEQIRQVDGLYVPATRHVPLGDLALSRPGEVQAALAAATELTPSCTGNGDTGRPRYVCTGRVTARLSDAGSQDQVFHDMADTVDYFVLDRAASGPDNLTDMNCSFGAVDIGADRTAGSSTYTCEGPLKP
ncbi:hypothetical protein GCM10010218_04140 [Streptomyces mashuensis]|uniref:microbial collagenase n=1 Tax=Streptomyces mashuensis TaxID=33904 RepID=A0A919AW77_9ACTN|nr:collagenase [Streptomyces mashuensis]GHF26466.1 hypothetical protein GCM10010218_04140 [Streptomyces mashuensis]